MANPVFINLPANTWTIVATNVVTGVIRRADPSPKYLHTYRDTGGTAPTDRAEGLPVFIENPDFETINSNTAIDVYLYPVSKAGRVRVDL
jgi:hypothetical protein